MKAGNTTSQGSRSGAAQVLGGHTPMWQRDVVRRFAWAAKVRLKYRSAALKAEYGLLSFIAAGWTKVGRSADTLCVWLKGQDENARCDLCQFVAVKLRLYLLRGLVFGYESLVLLNERRHCLLTRQHCLMRFGYVPQQLHPDGQQFRFVTQCYEPVNDDFGAGQR